MRYYGVVSYFGQNYVGWQVQNNKKSIEAEIEKWLSHILNEPINIIGAGRTDKGVHAYGQVFHFDTTKKIDNLSRLLYALNRLVPPDIKIHSLKITDENFHARFSAKKKEYLYKIYTGINRPFYVNSHYVINFPLDIKLLKKASKYFVGRHNFQNLTSKEIDDKNFVRIIYSINVKQTGDEIIIRLIGNGFMRYMVRDIVGEMIECALKRQELIDLKRLFKGPRKITNHKAPAQGLYLKKVYYDKN